MFCGIWRQITVLCYLAYNTIHLHFAPTDAKWVADKDACPAMQSHV